MSDRIQHLTSDDFAATVESAENPVLVDFWATWCGPCKALAPLLEEVAEERAENLQIVKVDVDANAELAMQYNVRSIPTLVLFNKGQVVDQMIGAPGRKQLEDFVDRAV